MKPALVFNCDYNGYYVIRALARQGFKVFALDDKRSVGTFSRYCQYIKVPNPMGNESLFISELLRLGRQFDEKPLLFPTNDHWVECVSKNWSKLETTFAQSFPSHEVVSLLLDKRRFAKWCQEQNVSAPKVIDLDEVEEHFPLAVKAVQRRFCYDNNAEFKEVTLPEVEDAFRFLRCADLNELKQTLSTAESQNVDVYLQELIKGDSRSMVSCGVAAYGGELLSYVFGKKVRGYPLAYGDWVVSSLQQIPNDLLMEVRRVLKALKYTGIAEFEYMEENSSRYRLIEINPRSWSWFGVTELTGVDLVGDLANAVLTSPASYKTSFPDAQFNGMYFAKIGEDLQNIALWYGRNEKKRANINLWSAFKFYFVNKGKSAGVVFDDPKVLAVSILKFFSGFKAKFKQRHMESKS